MHFVRERLVFDDGKRRVVHELDILRRRHVRERRRLGHNQSRVFCMHIEFVQCHDQRKRLHGVDGVPRGYVRDAARLHDERSNLRGLREWKLLEHGQSNVLHGVGYVPFGHVREHGGNLDERASLHGRRRQRRQRGRCGRHPEPCRFDLLERHGGHDVDVI